MAATRPEDEGADEKRMSFFEHLEELRQRLKVVILALFISLVAMFLFSIQPVSFSDTVIWLPLPTLNQSQIIPAQFVQALLTFLVPTEINVIPVVLNPWEIIIVYFKAALFLTLVVTSPVTTYEFWKFVAPALKRREKRLLVRISAPVVVLFVAGVLMSLLVILPFTFPFLYGFAFPGIQRQLRLDEFLDFVLLFSLAFGVAFELPVVMYGLSAIGLVNAEFWRRNWRYAVIGIFVFAAFITPDGSGVTMLLVALPMTALYAGGYLAILNADRRRAKSS